MGRVSEASFARAFLYVMGSLQKIDIGGLLSGGRQRLVVEQQVTLEPFEGSTFPAPAEVRLEVRAVGDILEIDGTIDVGMHAECGRCLADIDRDVHVDVEERLDVGSDAQRDPFGESNVLRGDRLDLGDLTTQLVCSAVPIGVVCSEGCKGLCPNCGKNRNAGPCMCELEQPAPNGAINGDDQWRI
jgi:uncharacterized protein